MLFIKKELYAYSNNTLEFTTVGDKKQNLFCSIDLNDIEKTLNAGRDPKDLTPFKDVLKKSVGSDSKLANREAKNFCKQLTRHNKESLAKRIMIEDNISNLQKTLVRYNNEGFRGIKGKYRF